MRNSFSKAIVADASVPQMSAAIPAFQLFRATLSGSFSSGTSAGTLKLQGCNDLPPAVPTNWVDIPNATAAVVAGAPVTTPLVELCHYWVRAVWTQSGGTGTITAVFNALGF